MFSSLFKLQLFHYKKWLCSKVHFNVPKRKDMLYKILYINLHFTETFNTDYVRHFNYVRQTDRHNLNFDVGELLYSWSESTGIRVTQSGLLQSFDTDS
jgi:hypothetical protein